MMTSVAKATSSWMRRVEQCGGFPQQLSDSPVPQLEPLQLLEDGDSRLPVEPGRTAGSQEHDRASQALDVSDSKEYTGSSVPNVCLPR